MPFSSVSRDQARTLAAAIETATADKLPPTIERSVSRYDDKGKEIEKHDYEIKLWDVHQGNPKDGESDVIIYARIQAWRNGKELDLIERIGFYVQDKLPDTEDGRRELLMSRILRKLETKREKGGSDVRSS